MTIALKLAPGFHLRAATADDAALMLALFAAGRQAELDLLPLNPEQKAQLLRMQFQAQTQAYRAQYPQADYQLLEREGRAIGRLLLAEQAAALWLVDIALLPQYQRLGLGTALVSALLVEAESKSLPVHLHVARANPALRLYQRLGFQRVERQDDAVYAHLCFGGQAAC